VNKSKEFLIGFFALVLLVVLYWGINFLKGENVFSDKRFFYAVYDNVNGLTISRPVTINGFKVGQVSDIHLNSGTQGNLIVEIAIEENITFSNNSVFEIYDYDIMGAKAVQIQMNDGSITAMSGDTLKGSIANGLTSEVSEQFGSVKVGLDQVIISFNKVLKEVQDLSITANRILVSNEARVSSSVQSIESISKVIESQTKNINNSINNISQFSNDLNSIDLIQLSNQMISISNNLDSLIISINQGEGSFSKLLNQDIIHEDLSKTIKNIDHLISDIQENPQRYVNISLWGNDNKK